MVLAVYNVFYNNLLINLRFYSKMQCVTFGICIFDCINYAFCYCFLQKPCRDRCFTIWTTIKWSIKAAIMGYTIWLVRDMRERWEASFEPGDLVTEPGTSNLDTYLIIYLLQHPIFIASRIPIFILYSILSCCCNKGIDVDADN